MLSLSDKQPPVVIFTHEFFPKKGGIAVFTQETALALSKLGYSVEVFAPQHPQLNVADFSYKVTPIPCKGTQDWGCRLVSGIQLLRIRKRLKNSILYLPEPGPIRTLMYLQMLPLIHPSKVILTLHGTEVNRLSMFPHRRFLLRQVLASCYKVTVPSKYTEQQVLQKFPKAKGKIILTPGALRSNLKILEGPPPSVRDPFKIITVARIHPRKGQHFLLEAINALEPEIKNRIAYQIIGPIIDQKYFLELKSYITKNNINVEFIGEVDDKKLARIYQKANLFAMTSRPYYQSIEGFGLSYLEASANGLPILAHKTGGVGDAVKDGFNGLLTTPGDRAGLVAALKRLLLDVDLRKSLSRGGREWVRRFSWENNAKAAFS